MRIGNWNLERCCRGARWNVAYAEVLDAMRSDVTVVTEPGPGFRDRYGSALLSPEDRPNAKGSEAWVALGHSLEAVTLEIDYRHLAVAGRTLSDGTGVLIYGSVLPWLSARTHAPDVYGPSERPFIDVFETALNGQVADMRELRSHYPSDSLVWEETSTTR